MEATKVMTNHTPAIRAVLLCCGDCPGKEIVIPSRTPTAAELLSDGTVRYRHRVGGAGTPSQIRTSSAAPNGATGEMRRARASRSSGEHGALDQRRCDDAHCAAVARGSSLSPCGPPFGAAAITRRPSTRASTALAFAPSESTARRVGRARAAAWRPGRFSARSRAKWAHCSFRRGCRTKPGSGERWSPGHRSVQARE